MDEKTKYRIKAYLAYVVLEPWMSKIHFPNLRVLNWIAIILSVFIFKSLILFSIFITIGIFFHLYGEWKSGRFVYWFRMRNKKIRKYKETIKKIREERRNPQPKDLNSIKYTKIYGEHTNRYP